MYFNKNTDIDVITQFPSIEFSQMKKILRMQNLLDIFKKVKNG